MIKKELLKMTKKEKREFYKQFRNTWQLNPITKNVPNAKVYNRKKFRTMKNDFQDGISYFLIDIDYFL